MINSHSYDSPSRTSGRGVPIFHAPGGYNTPATDFIDPMIQLEKDMRLLAAEKAEIAMMKQFNTPMTYDRPLPSRESSMSPPSLRPSQHSETPAFQTPSLNSRVPQRPPMDADARLQAVLDQERRTAGMSGGYPTPRLGSTDIDRPLRNALEPRAESGGDSALEQVLADMKLTPVLV